MKRGELKPCPFCGKEATAKKKSSGHNGCGEYIATFFVGCESCKIGFTRDSVFDLDYGEIFFVRNGYEEAKEIWNNRVTREAGE